MSNTARVYFSRFSDKDIQALIVACQEELELRSQENIKVGE